MPSYIIETLCYDDRGDEISRTVESTIYTDLAAVRERIWHLDSRTHNDDSPITSGWTNVFRTRELGPVMDSVKSS